ncbi:MAG TPA: Na(+)-translocating NADH-quinone reductase subunit A [Bacteroidales bacterium]|nr:Na(+)-translocating NADH-quinone reductase subunit A [Bacteroidales bacterium]
MPESFKLRKGFDIKLAGRAKPTLEGYHESRLYGVKPPEFPGLIPRLAVKQGDPVKAGTVLFTDKKKPEIRFASPVSGVVKDIIRGEQRRVLSVVIEKQGDSFEEFGRLNADSASRGEIIGKLLEGGLWPAIRQRPYHIIADPAARPKSIFISGFDTAPLAPDMNFVMDNSPAGYFNAGLKAISKLTEGKVHLVLNSASEPSSLLKNAANVQISYFSGPHPAGNVGVHIHHLDPVNKGETVWYINLQDVISAGRLFEEGRYKHERIIALAGPEVKNPCYYLIRTGAGLGDLTRERINEGDNRIISGNVLTGSNEGSEGFLGYYDSMVTVIPEGRYYEFFGWAKPGINKYSFSKTFLSALFRKKEYRLDTNMHGGHRAFVMTGQYEKVVPMDILPMQLFKAIIAEDIDAMENLGIYEVAEEDFALCEFLCPSKTEIQSLVRKGLDLMVKEMS